MKEEAKSWPVLCHIDQSSGKINVSKNLGRKIVLYACTLFNTAKMTLQMNFRACTDGFQCRDKN